jgi:hypothetical protein
MASLLRAYVHSVRNRRTPIRRPVRSPPEDSTAVQAGQSSGAVALGLALGLALGRAGPAPGSSPAPGYHNYAYVTSSGAVSGLEVPPNAPVYRDYWYDAARSIGLRLRRSPDRPRERLPEVSRGTGHGFRPQHRGRGLDLAHILRSASGLQAPHRHRTWAASCSLGATPRAGPGALRAQWSRPGNRAGFVALSRPLGSGRCRCRFQRDKGHVSRSSRLG